MLKKYKNGFLQIIEESGFHANQFRAVEKEVDNHPGFILQFVNSPLAFLTRTNSTDYFEHDYRYVQFAPSYPKSEYKPANDWCLIDGVYEGFKYWLEKHVHGYLEEIDIPDLWSQIERQNLFVDDPMINRSDKGFDKAEKERVVLAIEHFKRLIEVEYKPTEEQLEVINDRLGYLIESVDRLNKVDWQGVAISALMSISIALSLDTSKGRELFNLFKSAFTSAIEFIG
ncbi:MULTISPECIES: hypothetical protein [Vibrio]|uniref:hypothetical protein n=1 Tax=Vibrio TaxID=662 RepID=UPI0012AE7D48|nr:hypothetical protein [Vibrio sp. A14(2019)]EKO3922598.1 hypothetical protein [Vibrio metschnikovii]MDQ2194931.1 hypothetical protein [Vibrio sp. A14(2019)]